MGPDPRRRSEQSCAAHHGNGVHKLEANGEPPYRSQDDFLVERSVSEGYDTDAQRNREDTLRPVVLFAPDNSLHDIYSLLRRSKFAGNAMHIEMLRYDAPFFNFKGDKVRLTPIDLARRWFDTVDAAQKALVVLSHVGHSAMLTMSELRLNELVMRVRPMANPVGY